MQIDSQSNIIQQKTLFEVDPLRPKNLRSDAKHDDKKMGTGRSTGQKHVCQAQNVVLSNIQYFKSLGPFS